MHVLRLFLTITFYTNFVIGITPIKGNSDLEQNIYTEIGAIQNSLKIFSEQWEKWNTLFITSLEPRISTTASTLASIDSNVQNLQERAHVWDTFQLHVSAWNEQLASLDRKLDIISKGQEKLQEVYENKIATIAGLENKVENMFKKLSDIDETLSLIGIAVKKKQLHSRDSLFGEFAARGVLSSIKSVERKMDRVLLTNQNVILKNKGNDEKAKLTIKCNTPKIVEELLNDISSKVDVMFDSVTQKYVGTDYENEDYSEDDGATDNITSTPLALKLKPYNLVKRGLYLSSRRRNNNDNTRNTDSSSDNINTNIQNILRHVELLSEKTQECGTNNYEPLYIRMKEYAEESTKNLSLTMESYFSEQRSHIESVLQNIDTQNCDFYQTTTTRSFTSIIPTGGDVSDNDSEVYTITAKLENQDETTTDYFTTTKPFTSSHNIFSCGDLEYTENSAVYKFESSVDQPKNYFEGKRFCEIRDDGLWTVIQRRDNFTNQQDFNASWTSYKFGFGDLEKDFWLGNNILHELTKVQAVILRVELEDFEGNSAWANYDKFQVLSEDDKFQLIVSGYSGNASDSFSNHSGSFFSTYDRKNDVAPDCCPCAESYGGGWWFHRCFESNLNGVYYRNPYGNDNFRGIIWEDWLGNYSLKKSVMMIKPRGLVYSSINRNRSNIIPDYEDP